MHIQALILCYGAENHIAEMKAITKVGPQSILRGRQDILRVPLLFAYFVLKLRCLTADQGHGGLAAQAERDWAEQGRRSLPGRGQPGTMAAELHSHT